MTEAQHFKDERAQTASPSVSQGGRNENLETLAYVSAGPQGRWQDEPKALP